MDWIGLERGEERLPRAAFSYSIERENILKEIRFGGYLGGVLEVVSFWLVFAVDYLRQRGDWFFLLAYLGTVVIFRYLRYTHTWDGIWLSEEVYCV